MTKAFSLQPQKIKTPQCSQVMDEDQWNDQYMARRIKMLKLKGWARGRCNNHSSTLINKSYFCTVHAQKKALEILLKESSK